MKSSIVARVLISLLFSPMIGLLLAYIFTLNVSNFEGGRGIAFFYLTPILSVFSFSILFVSFIQRGKTIYRSISLSLLIVNSKGNENTSSEFRWWLYPVIFGGLVALWFFFSRNGYSSVSDKLDLIIPYLALGNVLLIIYVYIKCRMQIVKTVLASISCLTLFFLWCVIQVAR